MTDLKFAIASVVKKLEKTYKECDKIRKETSEKGLFDYQNGCCWGTGEALALIKSEIVPAFEAAVKEIEKRETIGKIKYTNKRGENNIHGWSSNWHRWTKIKDVLKILGVEEEAE